VERSPFLVKEGIARPLKRLTCQKISETTKRSGKEKETFGNGGGRDCREEVYALHWEGSAELWDGGSEEKLDISARPVYKGKENRGVRSSGEGGIVYQEDIWHQKKERHQSQRKKCVEEMGEKMS